MKAASLRRQELLHSWLDLSASTVASGWSVPSMVATGGGRASSQNTEPHQPLCWKIWGGRRVTDVLLQGSPQPGRSEQQRLLSFIWGGGNLGLKANS